VCKFGYFGDKCQFTKCFGINSINSSVCTSNGICTSLNICSCKAGYSGNQCEFPSCFGINSTNPSVCSGKGYCISLNDCNCSSGYYGNQCENFNCDDEPFDNVRACSGVGNCINPNQCQCNDGYVGKSCEFALCFGKNSSDSTICSSNGVCTGRDRCICRNPYTGDQCQLKNETISVITPECAVFKNNYIKYYKSKKSFVIEPSICSKKGWSGIAIHQKPGIDTAMFIAMSWIDKNGELKFGEMKNHQSKKLKEISSIGLLPPNNETIPELQYFQKQRFIIEIDQILLLKFNYISIVCADAFSDSSTFSYHQTVSTNEYNISNTKSVCDLLSLNDYSKNLADNSIIYWIFEILFYIALLLIAVQFRNYQPLKSRGFIPYLAILAQYGACLSSIQYFFFGLDIRSKYSCIIQSLLHENFVTTIFSIMPINYLRYILLINMNKVKENVSLDGKKRSYYFKTILFMKFLSQPGVSFFLLSFVWIFISLIDLFYIAVITPQFSCETFKSYGLYSIHLFFNVCYGIIFFTIGIIDIITNFVRYISKTKKESVYRRNAWIKLLWRNFIDFYFTSDPFYFRIEQLIAFIVFCFYLFVEILNYNALIFGVENSFHFYFGQFFLPAARSFIGYSFAFYQAFIPLLVTAIRLLIQRIKKMTKRQIEPSWDFLTNSLKDEDMFNLFLVFSSSEWSQENVLAHRDIEKFKRLKGKEKKENHAFNIYYTYLNGANSPLELNIDLRTRNDLFNEINNEDCKFQNDIFENVEKNVKINLSDTWSRFILTDVYSNYCKNEEIQAQEMEFF
jgi:hypothetical protein